MGASVLPARRVLEKPVCFSRRLSPPIPFSHWPDLVGGGVSIGRGAVSVPGQGGGGASAALSLPLCLVLRRAAAVAAAAAAAATPPLQPEHPGAATAAAAAAATATSAASTASTSPPRTPRHPGRERQCCLLAPPLPQPFPSVTYPLLAALARTFSDTPASLHHLLGQPRRALGLAVRAERKASSKPLPGRRAVAAAPPAGGGGGEETISRYPILRVLCRCRFCCRRSESAGSNTAAVGTVGPAGAGRRTPAEPCTLVPRSPASTCPLVPSPAL
nr:forkhead box protein D1-like [Gorilla gorilla gorilla]